MLSKFDIQKLQDLPIEQVAEALNISVSHHKAICPFHDDTRPSLTFNIRKNRYRCFVCNASGGTIDLVANSQGWKFYESCKWLAREFNVTLSDELGYFEQRTLRQQPRKIKSERPPLPIDVHHLNALTERPYLNEEACRFLFDDRKISSSVVRQLGLSSISQPAPMSGNPNGTWFNAPSLLIPYRDINGNLLSVQARYLGSDKTKPRFQFPKGSQCHIFNLQVVKTLSEGEELWITEGVSDCLAVLSSGRKAVAIPSATLLKPSDIEPLKHMNLHIAPDNDEPGTKLFLDLQKLLPDIHHHLLPSRYKDFGEYWKDVKS